MINSDNKEKIKKIAGLLNVSQSILFITGAGVSADSGLPTYRGIGGLYNDSATDEGISIETALAGYTLKTHPEITWKYLSQIEARCRDATFNRAHQIIAEMENRFKRVWVLTQNIDGFHQLAGSRNLIEIHGNMHKLLCEKCGWRETVKNYAELEIPPLCPECGSIARPDVVFFGEQLPSKELHTLYAEMEKGFDLYFSVGTTSVFPYIQEPILRAKSSQKPVIEINPADTEISYLADVKLALGAAEALNEIWSTYPNFSLEKDKKIY